MSTTQRDSGLRRALADPELLVLPGCFDALTARLIQARGFTATYLGGWTLGASLACGEPRTNLTDLLLRAQEIVRGIDIPLVVDGNAGFGDAVHMGRTIDGAQAAGIAGLHIEDQLYPKRMHYHAGVEHIVTREEMTAKVDAALEARADGPLAIIGRTDAIRAVGGSFEEAIERCRGYLEQGVDAVMLFPETQEQLEAAPRLIEGPVVYVWPDEEEGLPKPSVDKLAELGYGAVIYPIMAIAQAFAGVEAVIDDLRDHGRPAPAAEATLPATAGRIQQLLEFEKAYALERATTEG